jgi:hypothetical protein
VRPEPNLLKLDVIMTRRHVVQAIAGSASLLSLYPNCLAQAQLRQVDAASPFILTPRPGVPLMAVVALSEQRVTIYDAEGRILRAPVSTGQIGYETPAGIYSVIQKEAEHYSNLYDDASMPFMQRITWSGIALHAGVLPGYPASHGCIRMPRAFAERLFDLTSIGLRVIIVRDDMSPREISHPKLPKPGPIRSEGTGAADRAAGISARRSMRLSVQLSDDGTASAQTWRSIAVTKAAAAKGAAKMTEEARRVAVKAGAEASKIAKALRIAESARQRVEAQIRDVHRMFDGVVEPAAMAVVDELKTKTLEQLSEAQKRVAALKIEVQPKLDAAVAAREQVKAAQAAWVVAQNEAEVAERKAAPISVLISRKTQRLYARQASQPIFESAVTIQSPDDPIGTFVFTAVGFEHDGAELRWTALAMYANPTDPIPVSRSASRGRTERTAEPTASDTDAAKAALERITMPPEALDHIREFVSLGSSVIVSDEEASKETGKDTEFIVLMSGEPQGGLKIRRAYSAYR